MGYTRILKQSQLPSEADLDPPGRGMLMMGAAGWVLVLGLCNEGPVKETSPALGRGLAALPQPCSPRAG